MPHHNRPLWNNKLTHALIFLLSIPAALLIGKLLATGRTLPLAIIVGLTIATMILFFLKDKYWMAVAFSMAVNLPVLPIGNRVLYLAEVMIPLAFIVHMLRAVIHRDNVFHRNGLFIWLYFLVIVATFASNPVGFAAIGSESFGARYYFKVLLAFCSYIIIFNQKISDHDCGLIIRFLIIGSLVSFCNMVAPFMMGRVITSDFEYYTWHQSMAVPASMLAVWILSRYRIERVGSPLSSQFWMYMGCLLIIAISGKRAAFATVAVAPIVMATVNKKYIYVLVIIAGGLIALSALTYGHGRLFRLPLRVQRTLVFLPGKWESHVMGYRNTSFRSSMRKIAWSHVKQDPLRGRWGFHMTDYDFYRLKSNPAIENMSTAQLSTGISWHSTWLGIMADLGIPAAIIWACFLTQALGVARKGFKLIPSHTSAHTLICMYFLILVFHLLRSYTSGDSTGPPYELWWLYALAMAMIRTREHNKATESSV